MHILSFSDASPYELLRLLCPCRSLALGSWKLRVRNSRTCRRRWRHGTFVFFSCFFGGIVAGCYCSNNAVARSVISPKRFRASTMSSGSITAPVQYIIAYKSRMAKTTFIKKKKFHQKKKVSSKSTFIKKPLSSKNHFPSKNHFHQRPLSSETLSSRPLSSETTFITNPTEG